MSTNEVVVVLNDLTHAVYVNGRRRFVDDTCNPSDILALVQDVGPFTLRTITVWDEPELGDRLYENGGYPETTIELDHLMESV